ncbi:hypothetical protein [Paracoccus luteus]|uniref:hypothetical protein n=1 Tax=Paracoccus luteus TaxID=2508543 RepID=UPI00106FCD89|nr:hypothetical protein [Paracoccus luteus]
MIGTLILSAFGAVVASVATILWTGSVLGGILAYMVVGAVVMVAVSLAHAACVTRHDQSGRVSRAAR